MVTRTGIEPAPGRGGTGTYDASDGAGPSSIEPPDASGCVGTELDGTIGGEIPSAIPSFLEACARFAADAAARGDVIRARKHIEKAVRVAALPENREARAG